MAKIGRPNIWKDNKELEEGIEHYFSVCERDKTVPTLSGLAVFLEVDRKTILNYSKKSEFFHTIKKARNRIEAGIEQLLFGNKNVVGVIFNLKNNFDWKDRKDMDITSGGKPLPLLGGKSNGNSNNNGNKKTPQALEKD